MKTTVARFVVNTLALAAASALSIVPAWGQVMAEGGGQAIAALIRMQSNSTAPTPRAADGKPDLSGLWGPDKTFMYNISSGLAPGEEFPIRPWAAKLAKERVSKDDPAVACRPSGIPRQTPYPWKIVQTPQLIVFLYEGGTHGFRQIFMDRKDHPKDLEPAWLGDSIGHWEGNTLVVDTIGFNDKFWFDQAGNPHTEKLHTIERYTRRDKGHMDIDVTIDDLGAYTRPFTIHGHSAELANTEIMEYICDENNVDVAHITGKDSRK